MFTQLCVPRFFDETKRYWLQGRKPRQKDWENVRSYEALHAAQLVLRNLRAAKYTVRMWDSVERKFLD